MVAASARAQRRALLKDIRYAVQFDLTDERAASSHTSLSFSCSTPGAASFADLELANPTRITLNGVDVSSSYAAGRVELPDLHEQNTLVVEAEIEYATCERPVGLCSFTDDGQRFAYTFARSARGEMPRLIPCFLGADPAMFDICVTVPAGWSVASHSPPVEQPPSGSAGTWRFAPKTRQVAEALTFAAGPWEVIHDARGPVLYAPPSVREKLRSTPIPELLCEVLGFYERILGVEYPFECQNCVFIPGYPAQGTSTGGIWKFRDLLLEASLAEPWLRYTLWVLAHEAAHAWFGNLVFDGGQPGGLWLAEGIATYLCHRAMEHIAPELDPWATFHVREESGAHDADTAPQAHAIASRASDDGVAYMPALVYAKPAAVLRHLEALIGRQSVDAGLSRYLVAHAFGDGETDDLIQEWEAAGDVYLDSWAHEWLKTPGVNTLELEVTTSPVGSVQSARVFQSSSDPGGIFRIHHITIRAYDQTQEALDLRTPIVVTVAGRRTAVPQLAGLPIPDLVVLNTPATSYVKVRLDERSRRTIKTSLSVLDADTRAVCWVAGWEMVKDGLIPEAEFRTWVTVHGDAERDPQVRELLKASCDPPLPAWYSGGGEVVRT